MLAAPKSSLEIGSEYRSVELPPGTPEQVQAFIWYNIAIFSSLIGATAVFAEHVHALSRSGSPDFSQAAVAGGIGVAAFLAGRFTENKL